VRKEKILQGDKFLVLACDGIWNCLESQEVVDIVHEELRKGFEPKEVVESLLDRCLAPGREQSLRGLDNMTLILVVFK